MKLTSGQKLLFVGDSITDCGRRAAERPYGNGYVSLFMELQRAHSPELCIEYVNKGIGGNTIRNLRHRWEDDVIRERPDWLGIMIGINDCHCWLRTGEADLSPAAFRETYANLLSAAASACDPNLLLIDPFYISRDQSGLGFRSEVLNALQRYTAAVEDVAREHGARHVRMHEVFQRHLQYAPPDQFAPEPVHPFRSGHLIIAWEILQALNA